MTQLEKKRVQANIDLPVATEAESILDQLGLTPTTAITAFYKRVIAEGGLPFEVKLSQSERRERELIDAVSTLPVQRLTTKDDVVAWLNEE
jgi:DNA-damage-inducible protein J